jgi:hypothetical protein
MGYHIFSMKGKGYRNRCTLRQQPDQKGDYYVVSPASFPPLEYQVSDDEIIPELPKEDLDQVRLSVFHACPHPF